MAPYPKITCEPPLGQLSIIPPQQKEISFSVLIEWNKARPDYPFEVQLCYSSARTSLPPIQWNEQPMERTSELPLIIGQPGEFRVSCYVVSLSRSDLLEGDMTHALFTVKYRVNSHAPWNWTEIQLGTKAGELLFQEPLTDSIELRSLLDIGSGMSVEKKPTPQGSHVFRIESTISIPRDIEPPELATHVLGRIRNQHRYFTLVRLEPYWLGPRQGKDFFYIGEDAIVCSFLTRTGHVVTFVAVNGVDDIYTVFRSNEQGDIIVASRNDGKKEAPFRIVGAIASNLEVSLAAAMGEIRQMVIRSSQLHDLSTRTNDLVKGIQGEGNTQAFENWVDGLAYCTWNGLGRDLTASKVLSGLDKLAASDISISTLLIDDNWQTLASTESDYSNPFFRGWAEFEANKQGFPQGMKDLVNQIRKRHPGIRDIGVWHALFGYWGGLATEGKIRQTYKTRKIQTKLMGNVSSEIYVVDSPDIHRLYDDFYAWLSSCGLTFIKTDVQYMLGEFTTAADSAALTSTYQSAWTSAHLRHFSGKAISCMSQIPQLLFHSLLQTNTPPVVLRNSDDFYPEIAPSHAWHIWANAHNALFTQHLNVVLDWDMFQTSHEFSAFHGAARCLSGGPLLITDVPGEHDVELLREMTGVSPGGRTVALRTEVGKTRSVFNQYNEGNVLNICTRAVGAGILGVFNIAERAVSILVKLSDFPEQTSAAGFLASSCNEVVIRSHVTGQIFGPLNASQSKRPRSLVYTTLLERGYDIFTLQPVHKTKVGNGEISFSVLGLVGKMSGAAAVTSTSVTASGNGTCVQVSLKALGTLGIWLAKPLQGGVDVSVQGEKIAEGDIKSKGVGAGSQILEIDVLRVWKERALWNESMKEVQVDILFG